MAAEYCTLYALRDRLGFPSSDTTSDPMLHSIIDAASRAVEAITGRRFYASTETRYYQAAHASYLDVDDLLGVTTLATDEDANGTWEVTWTADTDYLLLPINASADGVPYSRIQVAPLSRYYFPVDSNPRNTKLVASFGYSSSVPDLVREATLLAAIQVYHRKDAAFGVMGQAGFLQTVKHQLLEDPQIRAMLMPYWSYL